MTHKIKVKMLQGVDLTPSTKKYLFRTSLTGLAQGDIGELPCPSLTLR